MRPLGPCCRTATVVSALLLVLTGCTDPSGDQLPVRIGAGSTTEQQVLAALTTELLRRSDMPAEIVSELGDTVDVRDQALDGRIDVYWDYSGAAWALSLGLTAPPINPEESFEVVADEEAGNGLKWVGPTPIDASLALFVQSSRLPSDQEQTLSWLAGQFGGSSAALCADGEYLAAPSGYSYLVETYAIARDQVTTRALTEGKALADTASGQCLAGLASATSGVARTLGLQALDDDLGVFPALVIAPVVAAEGRGDQPDVIDLLDRLAKVLTAETLADLNGQAVGGAPIDQLAGSFLDDVGLP
ncbi:hypothetical protein BH24ACT15_BH24ACT15_07190 [soil metagenome]